MIFFESDLAFRQHADEPIYDCRENCEMAIYRSTDIDEVNVWLKKLSENGFLAIRKNEIDGTFSPCSKRTAFTSRHIIRHATARSE